MLDEATLTNAILKRVNEFLGPERAGFSRLLPIVNSGFPAPSDYLQLLTFRDAVSAAILVPIEGHVFALTYKMPRFPEHRDAMNAVDYFIENIKKLRRNVAAAKHWDNERRQREAPC